jgi:hypothetical protein
MTTWRAMVEPNLPLDGVAIQLRRRLDNDQVEVVGPLMLQMETHIVDQGVALAALPMLCLSDEMAAALLCALAAYYGDAQTLRGELGRLADQVGAIAEHVGMVATNGLDIIREIPPPRGTAALSPPPDFED